MNSGMEWDLQLAPSLRNHLGDDSIIVFHHIPKVAGSAAIEELSASFSPSSKIFVENESITSADDYEDLFDLAFMRFTQIVESEPYKLVSGHFGQRHIQWFLMRYPARLLTFLRDPLSRLVSDYRYRQTPSAWGFRAFIERYPSFDHYLRDPRHRNAMTVAIAGVPDAKEAIEKLERNYLFCGLTEQYDLSMRVIRHLTGAPDRPSMRVNQTAARVANEVRNVESYRTYAEALNKEDVKLYSAACDLFWRRLEELGIS